MARKLKSGIVGQAQVIFGGAIRMELGWVKSARGEELAIGMAELKHPAAKAGDPIIDEETYNGTQVTLVFPGFESLNVFRHALDLLEAELKKRIAERDAQQKIDFDDADPNHLVHEHIDPPTFEEAQGGQKTIEKAEPKFRVGDLITNGILIGKIDEINKSGYHAYFGDHYSDVPDIENWHKWTIQDAKDSNKKELKRIEQNLTWSEEDEKTLNEIFSVAARASLRKSTLFGKSYDYIKWQNWLKSLRDRVQSQPKQEWSKEDERKINRMYSILRQAADTHAFSTSCRLIGDKECIELQDFLKSLRDRVGCEANCTTMWKPSEAQMERLKEACDEHYEVDGLDPLYTLYQDLQKLREK